MEKEKRQLPQGIGRENVLIFVVPPVSLAFNKCYS